MKNLLRRIIYWNAPAKGAFLHATVALTVPWCLSALLCFAVPILLIQKPERYPINSAIWLALIPFFAMPIVAFVETVAVAVCLIRLFYLRRKNRQAGTPRSWTTVCLGVLAALLWLSAILLPLLHDHSAAYTVHAVLLALLGYGCFGFFLSRLQSGVIGKGVLRLWETVAAFWLVSMVLAISANHAADRHCAEVEALHGRPPTNEARDEWLAQDCRIDAAFWQKAHEILQRRQEAGIGLAPDDEYVSDIAATSPDEYIKAKTRTLPFYRKQLAEFAELPVLEEMFSEALPLVLQADYDRQDVGNTLWKLRHIESWRLFFALKDRDMEAVEAVLHRIENLLDFWMTMQTHGYFNAGSLYVNTYFKEVLEVIKSSLPTDEMLRRMKVKLQKIEHRRKDALAGVSYFNSVHYNNQFYSRNEEFWMGEPNPGIYPLVYLLRTLDGAFWEKQSCRQLFERTVGRILLPQFWWLDANEKRIVFKFLNSKDFDNIPDYCCGSIMIPMFYSLWELPRDSPRYSLAKCRALQCMIDTVLEYRTTGAYPATLPSMLEDPFTGEPLKYRVGECWVRDGNQKTSKVQAVQIWSLGPNKTDDDGVRFNLPGDMQRKIHRRDDIRILLPLKAANAEGH